MMNSVSLNSSPVPLAQLIAPVPAIILPTNGTLYSGGLTLIFAGSATDYAGNSLPPTSFSWSGTFYSNGVVVPAFGPLTGVTSGSYPIPTNGPGSTNAFYKVSLTVTDTNGNTQSVSTEVLPETALVTLATVPTGLNLTLDGQSVTNSNTIAEIVGQSHVVRASSPQSLDSTIYNFVLWSDGGAPTHEFLVPPTNITLPASFVQPAISAMLSGSSFALSWPQWAVAMRLYSTTNLAAPDWILVTNPAANSNNVITVTVPTTNFMQFYRLQTP
jgi:hypothetical protein